MSAASDDPALESVSCLSDPVRRRLYDFVAGHAEPVGRDEAAAAVGIGRAIAVYHLDKLVESGLLSASYRRPAGRSGPGAGRPAKFYRRSQREFTVTVPPRDYELAAHLLAHAVAADSGGASQAALFAAARRFGQATGADHQQPGSDTARVTAALGAHGFAPWPGPDGAVMLGNCPFHQLAAQHAEIVCHMNLALIEGLLDGLGAGMHAELDSGPGKCCVVIRAGQPPAEAATTGAR